MKIEARLRRRVEAGESLREANEELILRLRQVDFLWNGDTSKAIHFDAGHGERAATDLSPQLKDGIRGAVNYASRLAKAVTDKAISDDSLVLQIDSSSIDLRSFATDTFPLLIKAFEPYRASIVTDLEQDLDDFENIVQETYRTGLDVDGRDTVFRLHAVNYFDDTMCARAFKCTSSELASKVTGLIKLTKKLPNGALLVLATEPVSAKALAALNAQILGGL